MLCPEPLLARQETAGGLLDLWKGNVISGGCRSGRGGGDTSVAGCRLSCLKFCRTSSGDGSICSIFGTGNAWLCKKSHVFQYDLLCKASGGALFAFKYGHVGKRIERKRLCGIQRSKGMSKKVLEFEESRKVSTELMDRVADLQWEIRGYESRMENLESLLDSILICLNAYDNGESQHSLRTIFDAIVQDIYLFRLQDELTQFANS